jgi:glucan endo-1,3-alpha-glucosidase
LKTHSFKFIQLLLLFFVIGITSCNKNESIDPGLEANKSSSLIEAGQRKVFAHYMLSNKSYGNGSVSGYKRDIQDAQSMGVDGFALNAGEWNSNYQQNAQNLFQAATELGTGFKFYFSIDECCGMTTAQKLDMASKYAEHPNYYRYNNRPVLSAWTSTTENAANYWNNEILTPLRNKGIDVFFWPFFYTLPIKENPDYSTVLNNYNLYWKNFMQGYFHFGVGLPIKPHQYSAVQASEDISRVMNEKGMPFRASVTPYYWGEKQTNIGRRYFEHKGGEGLELQWKSIIEIQKPAMIELVTWNDYGEGTYFSPIDDIMKPENWPWLYRPLGYYKTHRGFSALNKYYIEWYKSGVQPSITKDALYFFYRTHPKDMTATNDAFGPVTWRIGDVKDEIYITTMLTSPAQLKVTTGGVIRTFEIPKGIAHTAIPFNAGSQIFELYRNGSKVLSKAGENIVSSSDLYNYNLYSDFIISATTSETAPLEPTPTEPTPTEPTPTEPTPTEPVSSEPEPTKPSKPGKGLGRNK